MKKPVDEILEDYFWDTPVEIYEAVNISGKVSDESSAAFHPKPNDDVVLLWEGVVFDVPYFHTQKYSIDHIYTNGVLIIYV